jgi:hypothetical protein
MSYSVVDSVTPPYPLMVAGEPAWGGQLSGARLAAGAGRSLAAYVGEVVRLRLSFRSDSSGNAPGIYVDDFLVQ